MQDSKQKIAAKAFAEKWKDRADGTSHPRPRALYLDSSLADLYDEVTMPPELRRAHQDIDRDVLAAYGFPVKGFTESDCITRLFEMYQRLKK